MNRRIISERLRQITGVLFVALGLLGLAGGAVLSQSGPASAWWVIAGGGAPASSGAVALNDTLGQSSVGSASGGTVTINGGYWFPPFSAELQCDMATESYTLGPAPAVIVEVETLGDLDCLRVARTDADHPNATGSAGGSGVGRGGYWVMTATDSAGDLATGYALTLTLPHGGSNDPQVCRWLEGAGPGYGWDCARDGFDANVVWRSNITDLSEWAVGSHIGPTSVTLTHFAARLSSLLLVAAVLLIAALVRLRGRTPVG